MTSQPQEGGNRYLGDSQRPCRNSCLTFKGQADHIQLGCSPSLVFLVSSELRLGAGRVGGGQCRLQRGQTAMSMHTMPQSRPSGLLGRRGALTVGLGERVFACAILGREQVSHFALFPVSSNTIEVLLRFRERLQSALLRERGAAAPAFGRLFNLWIQAKL